MPKYSLAGGTFTLKNLEDILLLLKEHGQVEIRHCGGVQSLLEMGSELYWKAMKEE